MSSAKIIGSAPYFVVSDLTRSLNYYCDVLGFTRPPLWGEAPEFAMPRRDDFIVMLHQTTEAAGGDTLPHNCPVGGAWDAYFWVSDADALFAEFEANDAQIAYEPTIRAYDIKEFAVHDPDGYVLAFGQHHQSGSS